MAWPLDELVREAQLLVLKIAILIDALPKQIAQGHHWGGSSV